MLKDLWTVVIQATSTYDTVVLDLDNGPTALVQKQNTRLYGLKGLQRIAGVLESGGEPYSGRPEQTRPSRKDWDEPASTSKSFPHRCTRERSNLRSASTWDTRSR